MKLTADYHTHTVFSHGKGKIIDNAIAAKNAGLKEIAISDHGFSHPAFGVTKGKVATMRYLCDKATEKVGVKVLLGIESNIISTEGHPDLKPNMYDSFDVFLAGIHKCVLYKFKSIFTLSIPDLFYDFFKNKQVPEYLIKNNTKAYVNLIKKHPVDVITHLNYGCFADVVEVAKVASDYGTYIELNAKKTHLTDEQLYAVEKTGVNFIIGSDAHSPERVGEISLVEQALERVQIPESRIVNVNGKIPRMRFKEFKERG